jgi:hypothetical protein
VTSYELPGVPAQVQQAVTNTVLAILAKAGEDTKGRLVGDKFVFDKDPDPGILDAAWREACDVHGVRSAAA